MTTQTEVFEAETQFDILRSRQGDEYNIRLQVSIFFRTAIDLEHLVVGPARYYADQVPYELDRDDERREEYGSNQYYLLHVVCLSDVNPGYSNVVQGLLGREICEMLNLSWREDAIAAAIAAGEMDFDGAWMARDMNQVSREAYRMPSDVAESVLKSILFQ